MEPLKVSLEELNIMLVETKPINYGRQLKICAGQHWAEVNLFYGKQGFKIVQTAKTGTNKQLAELGTQAIQLFFDNFNVNFLINRSVQVQ